MHQPVTHDKEAQSAASVLMVRPARFAFNPQTAATNAFQVRASGAAHDAIVMGAGGVGAAGGAREGTLEIVRAADDGAEAKNHLLALREFDAAAEALQRAGVEVIVAEDTASPVKPDAIFPNNWVSFHPDGTVVLYPMMAPNRRLERREDVISQVAERGFGITRTVDLTYREGQGKFLEGTGSLVLDRAHRLAYACLSARTDLDVLGEFAQQLDYELVTFDAFDAAGKPVYHTNVLMAIGDRFAVLCTEAIPDATHRRAVVESLRSTGHEVMDITSGQMHHFAGNLLELASPRGAVIALSHRAWGSLDAQRRRLLQAQGDVVAVDIPVIERLGGGGIRCMLAEIHLPKRDPRR